MNEDANKEESIDETDRNQCSEKNPNEKFKTYFWINSRENNPKWDARVNKKHFDCTRLSKKKQKWLEKKWKNFVQIKFVFPIKTIKLTTGQSF